MDTWATSSLTPQIVTGWLDDPDLFERTFPMDLRPQAHDIIRTWLFYTIVRSHYEHDALPWRNAAISGFIVDPDRKKLSKSAANAPTDPDKLIERYGADGVRYWAARGRPGMDVIFDEKQLKIGRRLAIKLLNASKFALGLDSTTEGEVTEPLDRAMLSSLADLVAEATAAFDRFDYARALERTESFFWSFCDDYLELVKNRAYSDEPGAESAKAALRLALETLLKLFAVPPLRHEEVWSWWQEDRSTARRGRLPTSCRLARAGAAGPDDEPNPRSWPSPRRCWPRSAGRRARPSARCAPRSPRGRHGHADRLPRWRWRPRTWAAGRIDAFSTQAGDESPGRRRPGTRAPA